MIELVARLAVIGSSLSLLAVGLAVLVREQAAGRSEPVHRDSGPLAIVNFVGIVGFVVVGLVSALTTLGTLPELAEPVGSTIRVVGVAVLIEAGLLAVWGLRSIGGQMSSQAEVRPDSVLVTSGAFALVRHPLYLSILLLWGGGALALLSPVMVLLGLALVPPFVARSHLEERLLVLHFGDAYLEYARRVPMLLPRLGGR